MPAELIRLKLKQISLVKSPANGEKLVLKSGELGLTFELQKFSDEKQIAYGIVYTPNIVDSQGDWATAATIEQAANDFMQQGLTKNIDLNHDFENSGAFIAESWIVKQGDSMFSNKVGAWAVGIKVPDVAMWTDVKAGKYTGLSLAGTGQRVQKSDETEQGLYQKFKKWLSIEQKQQDDNAMTDDDFKKIEGLLKPVAEELAKANTRLDKLEKQASPENNNEPLTKSDIEAIVKAALVETQQSDDKGDDDKRLTKSDIEAIVKAALVETQQDDKVADNKPLTKQDVGKIVKNAVADLMEKGSKESGGGKESSGLGQYHMAQYSKGDK